MTKKYGKPPSLRLARLVVRDLRRAIKVTKIEALKRNLWWFGRAEGIEIGECIHLNLRSYFLSISTFLIVKIILKFKKF